MKTSCFFAFAFLLIGAIAFAQSDSDFVNVGGGSSDGEIALGFIMNLDKEDGYDLSVAPGIDLGIRAYVVNLGNEFTPLNIGLALEGSVGFPSVINWKVPGLKQIKKDKDDGKGNAFWPGGYEDPDAEVPIPKEYKVGSQTLLPGKMVTFSKDAGDFDKDASLLNVSFLVGLSLQAGFGGGLGFVGDLGFAGSYDNASFKSHLYNEKDRRGNNTGNKQREVIELSTFNMGVGGNFGLQYRIPLGGNSAFIIEIGSGLYLFFARTSEVDWYIEDDAGKKKGESLWNDKTDTETVDLFRTAPYITIGLKF